MGIVSRLLQWFDNKHYSRQELDTLGRRFVLDEVAAARQTIYGKQHNFDQIKDYHDFMTKVPLVEYDDLLSYIEQGLHGSQNVLTPHTVVYFAKSAGSTSAVSKYLPVTDISLKKNHRKSIQDMIACYLKNNPQSKLLHGKTLLLPGGFEKNSHTGEENIGFISAILHKTTPRYIQARYSSDDTILHMHNREEKLTHIIYTAKDQNIVCIGGVGPWIVMLGEYTQKILGKTPREVWPNLELILSGAVNISIYKDQYTTLFGDGINIYNVYNASEGFYAYQDNNTHNLLHLITDRGIWFEFICMDDYQGTNSQTISLADIQIGIEYALVITTQSGLWRYINGDVICFDNIETLQFHIVGRTKFFINTFDEKTSVDHTNKAITYACTQTNSRIVEYTVGPKFLGEASKGMHEWIIEFIDKPEDMHVFTRFLDEGLQEANSHYKGKRSQDVLMVEPLIHVAPKGTFHAWFASKGKLGGQSKVPSVQNDREVLEEILALIDGL